MKLSIYERLYFSGDLFNQSHIKSSSAAQEPTTARLTRNPGSPVDTADTKNAWPLA